MRGFQIDHARFESHAIPAGLYVVATPIGNLRDITLRGLEVLASANLIACEDTRVSAKLLRHYGIRTKTVSYHEHNARSVEPKLLAEMQAGKAVALISDAGTPVISDPGITLVQVTRDAGIPVVSVPGPSSPIAALAASGLSAGSFLFVGFLPTKKLARASTLDALFKTGQTLVCLESPKRLTKTLADLVEVFGGDHIVSVARELTKMHEETLCGPASELLHHFEETAPRGEIVLIVEPAREPQGSVDPAILLGELLQSMSVSSAVTEAHAVTKLAKRELYTMALKIKEKN